MEFPPPAFRPSRKLSKVLEANILEGWRRVPLDSKSHRKILHKVVDKAPSKWGRKMSDGGFWNQFLKIVNSGNLQTENARAVVGMILQCEAELRKAGFSSSLKRKLRIFAQPGESPSSSSSSSSSSSGSSTSSSSSSSSSSEDSEGEKEKVERTRSEHVEIMQEGEERKEGDESEEVLGKSTAEVIDLENEILRQEVKTLEAEEVAVRAKVEKAEGERRALEEERRRLAVYELELKALEAEEVAVIRAKVEKAEGERRALGEERRRLEPAAALTQFPTYVAAYIDVETNQDIFDTDKADQEKTDKDKADHERKDKDKSDQERKDKDKADHERKDKDKANQERKDKDKADQERKDKDKADQERKDKDKSDHERKDKDKSDQERKDKDKAAHERKDKDKADHERKDKDKADQERKDKEKRSKPAKSDFLQAEAEADAAKIGVHRPSSTDVPRSSDDQGIWKGLEDLREQRVFRQKIDDTFTLILGPDPASQALAGPQVSLHIGSLFLVQNKGPKAKAQVGHHSIARGENAVFEGH